MMTRCWLCLLVWGAAAVAAQRGEPGYQRSGTPEVAGIRHLCLIYHGAPHRVEWTRDAIFPYVAHVDEKGVPTDWMFDSFLFIEFAGPRGVWFHHYVAGKPQATADDWAWLADCWFREKTGLIGLEKAVARAGEALRQPGHVVNVVITLPVPLRPVKEFGPLAGQDRALDFGREEDRRQALAWYIDRVLARWREQKYRHLRLVGFYWTEESIPPADYAIVRATADLVHKAGYKLFWIPYFSAQGISEWRKLGIDGTMLQPNYFFPAKADPDRLAKAASKALAAGCGIEIEFDGRAFDSQERQDRFWAYLDAGVKYGWMNDVLLGYYEGGNCIKRFVETPGDGRRMYDALYRFLKGTYEPSGRTKLAELMTTSAISPPERSAADNLALASKGAKITGCARSSNEPELAPEKVVDGVVSDYGGQGGFGYFPIPGSLTIELPTLATVSRTQLLLWDQDDRWFQYRIETSADGKVWTPAVDKSKGEWRSWQVDRFPPREARFIRLTGLHNSINTNFQVVEFEVYAK